MIVFEEQKQPDGACIWVGAGLALMKVSHDKLAKHVFPLPDFTMFMTATYSGSARDKFTHPHLCFILTIAMIAQTCIRLLEEAFKSAMHDYMHIYTFVHAFLLMQFFWTLHVHALEILMENIFKVQCNKIFVYMSWCLCWTVGHFPVSSKLSDTHSHTHTHSETRQEMASLYTHKNKTIRQKQVRILTKPKQTLSMCFSHNDVNNVHIQTSTMFIFYFECLFLFKSFVFFSSCIRFMLSYVYLYTLSDHYYKKQTR